MALNPGEKLGPYEIQSPLGAGGMGEVYRARDTRLDRVVAIKVVPRHLSSNPEFKQRFEREARTLSSLNHPHICQLHDVGSQDCTQFLVMEFLDGETLADRLRRGPLPLPELLRIAIETCEALEIAHRAGIVHRDLKPGNIMLTKTGTKLMDFGLAKPASVGAAAAGSAPLLSAARTMSDPNPISPLTTAGSVVGTIQYMSPEQIEGKSQISVASAILEKDPEPIRASKPLTPAAFEYLVVCCLAKDREERFQSAHDVRLQLKGIAQSPLPAGTEEAQTARSIGLRLLGLSGSVLFVAALVIFFLSLRTDVPTQAVREALFGNQFEARRSAEAALELSKGRDVEYGAALALGLVGDSSRSEALASDLEQRFPQSTLVRFNYVPTVRALAALNRGKPSNAIELLEFARPYELGFVGSDDVALIGSLYPAYVRGMAYLAQGQGAQAAGEFQKILDHRGIVFADPISALAHLQLGRAYVLSRDKVKANVAYRDFLTSWKDADPGIPILEDAKTEYARLQLRD